MKGSGAMKVVSVNIGRAVARDINGRRVLTAIAKQPQAGPVDVGLMGLAGDEQADLSVHGGLSKAVYAYGAGHYAFWQTVRAQARVSLWDEPLPPGLLGENLTVEGLDEALLWIGDAWCCRAARWR
jgi:MOSC domain-containing protein YiiM